MIPVQTVFDKLSPTIRFRCQAELVEALLNRNDGCETYLN